MIKAEIAETHKIGYGIVQRHFVIAWLCVWPRFLQYKLTKENLVHRMSIYNSLQKRQESDPILKGIVTGLSKDRHIAQSKTSSVRMA